MQVDLINVFCDVAQHRSVSHAAKLHGVTQSAVSQRLQALEREVGTELVDRRKRPLQLTAAGEVFYQGCRQMLDRYAQLKREVSEASVGVQGRASVAAIYSAGVDLLHQAVEGFRREHPQAEVEVQYHQPDDVHHLVVTDQVDLGILSYPERWRDLASIPLREEQMVVACRPDHPLGMRERLSPTDLANEPLVLFEQRLPISRHILRYLRRHGVTPRIAHVFDNIDSIKSFLVHSPEAAVLPARTIKPEVHAGSLVAVPLEPALTRPVAIVHNRQRDLTPLIQKFIGYLTDHCAPEPAAEPAAVATAPKAD